MRRVLTIAAAVTVLASCAGDGTADEATTTSTHVPTTSTTEQTTTTERMLTTTTAPTTTTTAPPTTTTSIDDAGLEGSGCTPGDGDLPDGVWYGQVASWDDGGISFDLACWFTGDAAVAAAAEDGEEPPPNDYYVRNQNTDLRDLSVDTEAQATWYPTGDPNDARHGDYQDWTAYLETGEFRLGIWVTIIDGEVTEILEQWVP